MALGKDRLSANSLRELEQMLDNLEQALEVMEKSIFAVQCARWKTGYDRQVWHASQLNQ
jgi:transcription initiation factor IIE alpha subunit